MRYGQLYTVSRCIASMPGARAVHCFEAPLQHKDITFAALPELQRETIPLPFVWMSRRPLVFWGEGWVWTLRKLSPALPASHALALAPPLSHDA